MDELPVHAGVAKVLGGLLATPVANLGLVGKAAQDPRGAAGDVGRMALDMGKMAVRTGLRLDGLGLGLGPHGLSDLLPSSAQEWLGSRNESAGDEVADGLNTLLLAAGAAHGVEGAATWAREGGLSPIARAVAGVTGEDGLAGRYLRGVDETLAAKRAAEAAEAARPTIPLGSRSRAAFVSSLDGAVRAGTATPGQARGTLLLNDLVAKDWAGRTGRSVDDYYRVHAPEAAYDQSVPEGALNQYESKKLGPDRTRASAEDLTQFLGDRDEMPVHFTMADRAINGDYYNPATGARFRMYGGPGYGLDDPTYGLAGWANDGASAAQQILRGASGSNGLVLPYVGALETVLGSMHGPMAFDIEALSAIRNGDATPAQIRDLANYALDRIGMDPMKSRRDLLNRMRRASFETRKGFVKKAMPKRQTALPDWESTQNLMTDPRLRDATPGDVASALYIDPMSAPTRAKALGVPNHPAYRKILPGINMGGASGVNLRTLFPEPFEATRKAIAARRGVEPGDVPDGTVYAEWRYNFERKGGNANVTREQLEALADDGRGAAPGLSAGAAGRLADDGSSAAGALRKSAPGTSNKNGPLYQRSLPGEGPLPSGTGAVVKGAFVDRPGLRPLIHLFTGVSDVTTLVHELAHDWRRTLDPADVQKLANVYGPVGSVGYEEGFARAFERYLRDGKAPSPALRSTFRDFRGWMGRAYGPLRGSPLEAAVHPEVRAMFDRMLGGDERPLRGTPRRVPGAWP